jgi:Tfp pilus assembly protein PilO
VKSLSNQSIGIIAFAVCALVVALAGFLLGVRPQQSKAKALDLQIANAQSQYNALYTAGNTKPALRAAELFQLSRAMPDSDDMPGIVLELSRLSASAHVKLMAIQPSPRIALTDGSSAVPVKVTVDGTWTQLARFLGVVRAQVSLHASRLSVGGRLFDIDNIQITPTETSSTIEAVLSMVAFDYGAPPSATATAGASSGTTTTSTTPATSGSQQAAGTGGSS